MNEKTSLPINADSFNRFLSDKKLMGTQCTACDEIYLPPRSICPRCKGTITEWIELSGEGEIAAFTSIHIAPTFMIEQGFGRDAPYLTGIIELKEGPKISARILGLNPTAPEITWIGTPARVEYLCYGEGESQETHLAFRVI